MSLSRFFLKSDFFTHTGCLCYRGVKIWKPFHWMICCNYHAFVRHSINEAQNNAKEIWQVSTHRVSDHCQHANQGQGADGERKGCQTIWKWKGNLEIWHRPKKKIHQCSRVFVICQKNSGSYGFYSAFSFHFNKNSFYFWSEK